MNVPSNASPRAAPGGRAPVRDVDVDVGVSDEVGGSGEAEARRRVAADHRRVAYGEPDWGVMDVGVSLEAVEGPPTPVWRAVETVETVEGCETIGDGGGARERRDSLRRDRRRGTGCISPPDCFGLDLFDDGLMVVGDRGALLHYACRTV